MKSIGRALLLPTAIIAWTVFTRGILLASPDLMANPDECLLGRMALERLRGGPPSCFVWGQNYGLSFFEVELAALAMSWFGPSMAVLKGSMLVPFSLGASLLAAWLRRAHGDRAAWVGGLLIPSCPGLLPFSTQIHGGYLTAFAFAQFALWLLETAPQSGISRFLRLAAFSTSLGVVALGQPIWLPFVFVVAWLHRDRSASWLVRAAPLALALALAAIVKHLAFDPTAHHVADPFAQSRPWDQLLALPERLMIAFSGRHVLNLATATTTISTIAAVVWIALLVVAAAHVFATLRAAWMKTDATGIAGVVTSLVLLAAITGVNEIAFGPRYLLPVLEATVVLAARLFDDRFSRFAPRLLRGGRVIVALAAISGAASVLEAVRDPRQTSPLFELSEAEKRSLDATIADLRAAGVEHAFVINGMLQWTVMFESKGEIVTRCWWQIDRRMDFPPRVDRALREGKPTAIVGRDVLSLVREFAKSRGIEDRLVVHDERWYHILNPDEDLVKAMNFRLSSE